jgi:nucleoside-diphosphate-sugar epimerase
MAPMMVEHGFDVVGIDTGYFEECRLVSPVQTFPEIRKDIRMIQPGELEGFDAVVHLAALSNDPIGNLNQEWTEQINYLASVRLARLARDAGVRRFLFSSSCIMYGMSEASFCNEESPLDPKTEYAKSKVKAEHAISALAVNGFSPTFLRNGTVYGLSTRMRFDTVLNDLVGSALARGKVTLCSDGQPWRPVVHVEDIARSFMTVLVAPVEKSQNQVFNNGADFLNKRIIELAEIVVQSIPGSTLEVRGEPGADQRTYRADFSKFSVIFPDFEFKWTVEDGAKELIEACRRIGLGDREYTDPHFIRLKWLRHLLDTNQLDTSLYWKKGEK